MKTNKERWLLRKNRVRKKIKGTPSRPRLTIYKSLQNLYVQIIDDISGKTLVSASTMSQQFKKSSNNIQAAEMLGKIIGDKAIEHGINKIVCDRNGYIYHGKIAKIVNKIRETGVVI